MSTQVSPAATLPLMPKQDNSIRLEGTIKEIKPQPLPSGLRSLLVNIEHRDVKKDGNSFTTPWFWLHIIGDSVARFERDYSVGSHIWVRGRLTNHRHEVDGKVKRLILIVVQEMASKRPEGE